MPAKPKAVEDIDLEKGTEPGINKVGTVEVNKDKLDQLLNKVDEQQKTIEMLLATADKGRVARYLEQQGQPIVHTYKVRLFKGQVVLGWAMKSDEMYQDANGLWHERQIVQIVTEDNQVYEMPYLESEKLEKVLTTYVGSSTRDGVITLTLRMLDGREISIDQTYVN